MKKIISLLFIAISVALVAGCASGPRYSQLHSTERPLAVGDGRIYVYRPAQYFGSGIQPEVNLNGQPVGNAVPGGYFYVDRPAGNYTMSLKTEVKRTLSLTLDPGQKRYVRLNVSMGFFVGHVWPELMDNQDAENQIADCHYIGD